MSETTISKEEVAHVAHLAKLAFDDAELEQFTTQLGDILTIFTTLVNNAPESAAGLIKVPAILDGEGE